MKRAHIGVEGTLRSREQTLELKGSSSWLNQVELWFAKIERDTLAGGIFTWVADLKRKIIKYIRHYNKVPKPIRWTYADPTRRIA